MAKSLRSKWRRKMKAEKRVRYGDKELQRLKDMLTKAGDYQMVGESPAADIAKKGTEEEQIEVSEKIPINALPKFKKNKKRDQQRLSRRSRRDGFNDDSDEDDDVEMDSDKEDGKDKAETMSVDKVERVFSKRTMKDQFGNYPVWMNKRKIMTQQKKNKRIAKNRAMSVAGGKRSKSRR